MERYCLECGSTSFCRRSDEMMETSELSSFSSTEELQKDLEQKAKKSIDMLVINSGLRDYDLEGYGIYRLAKKMAVACGLNISANHSGYHTEVLVYPNSEDNSHKTRDFALPTNVYIAIKQFREIGAAGKIPQKYSHVHLAFLREMSNYASKIEEILFQKTEKRLLGIVQQDHNDQDALITLGVNRRDLDHIMTGIRLVNHEQPSALLQRSVQYQQQSQADKLLENAEKKIKLAFSGNRDDHAYYEMIREVNALSTQFNIRSFVDNNLSSENEFFKEIFRAQPRERSVSTRHHSLSFNNFINNTLLAAEQTLRSISSPYSDLLDKLNILHLTVLCSVGKVRLKKIKEQVELEAEKLKLIQLQISHTENDRSSIAYKEAERSFCVCEDNLRYLNDSYKAIRSGLFAVQDKISKVIND